MIVVIPSNRALDLDCLGPLIESGAEFIVVDDSPGSIEIDHPAFRVYNWDDRKRMLGDLDPHFPRRNGACRSFGFYVAWCEADADEIVIALDDDCQVVHRDFAGRVEQALQPAPRPIWKGAGRHANILELYSNTPAGLFPRGFPYQARAGHEPWTTAGTDHRAPKFNLGMWTDAFDINGIDKVKGPPWRHPQAELRQESVVVPDGVLVSVCSMNMQFRNALTPAAYQLPMHVEVIPNHVVDRYGDIWGGFVLKTLMDRRGDVLAVGGPMIAHRKAGDERRNTWQEHICHMINDEFVDLLYEASREIGAGDYLAMLGDLNEGMQRRRGAASPLLGAYLDHLGPALNAWVQALGRGRAAGG